MKTELMSGKAIAFGCYNPRMYYLFKRMITALRDKGIQTAFKYYEG